MTVADRYQRPLRSLRVSVTDRCNLRCAYCMPEPSYVWLPKRDLLSFEELSRLTRIFAGLGVNKLRLTGGEPLLRQQLPVLVEQLAQETRFEDLALTTNGVLLAEHAPALRASGLKRVTVSLDTLSPARFFELTRRDDHARVLAGIDAVARAGFPPPKLDTVILRGFNDDELLPLLAFARSIGAELRFIEYMDVGGATNWSEAQVVSRREMLERITAAHGPAVALPNEDAAPADRFRLEDGTIFGIISSTTEPFCSTCDRARLTADGTLYLCLYAQRGLDLRALLRGGATDDALAAAITGAWSGRSDRGAEQRLGLEARAALVQIGELRRDPRLEMHTRGG